MEGFELAQALIFTAAVVRTWLVDVRIERDRTYRGAVLEYFAAAGGMGGKWGLGYLRSKRSTALASDDLIYLYLGFGL